MSDTAANDPSAALSGSLPVLPLLGQAEIEARFDQIQVKAALKDAFLGLSDGQSLQPPQSLDLGETPLADALLTDEQLSQPETTYPLIVEEWMKRSIPTCLARVANLTAAL